MSREAPVLILEYDSTEIVPGGAGNAANNVAALGGTPSPSASPATTSRAGGCSTSMRPRIDVAERRHAHGADARRPRRASSPAACTRRSSRSSASIAPPRAPIPEAGSRARSRARLLRRCGARATRCSCPTTAPGWSRRRWCAARSARCAGPAPRSRPSSSTRATRCSSYRGMTACTPNESEVEQLLGVRIGENARVLERAGRELLERTRAAGRADHARQPRHGAVRAGPADGAHSDLRLRSDRRRHRRGRHGDCDDDAGARGRRHVRSRRRAWPTTPAAWSS